MYIGTNKGYSVIIRSHVNNVVGPRQTIARSCTLEEATLIVNEWNKDNKDNKLNRKAECIKDTRQ